MRDIWSFLLQTLTVSGVAALLLILKAMFRDKLSPRWQFAAWGVLGLMTLVPAGLGGRYTLLNWPFLVEALRSSMTGEFGALARVIAPVPLPPGHLPRSFGDWLFLIYVLGVVFFLARYIVSYVRLRRALRQGKPSDGEAVQTVAVAYGLPTCPAVEVEGLPTAFICGVFKPVLALPAGAEVDEKVILHELLHLEYRDALWGMIICLFRCLHWCNPLLWFCANLAGNDLEALCDQRVLERLEGEDRRDYGIILLSMADEKYARVPGTSSMANGGENIRRRIESIARFKRYPKGMGLVSVCMILLLTVPLIIGARAEVVTNRIMSFNAAMARARTTYCTTYAGALDTYAKTVIPLGGGSRAMCAPLSEQNSLAKEEDGLYRSLRLDTDLGILIDRSSGYHIYNLVPAGKDAYEGLLVLPLSRAPIGVDSMEPWIWAAVQTVRAEKEFGRWVVIPLEDFHAVQLQNYTYVPNDCPSLPALVYEAQAENFTLQLLWQSDSYVENYTESVDWFSNVTRTVDPAPQPDGEFTSHSGYTLYAIYTGDPADKSKYTRVSAVCEAVWDGTKQPLSLNTSVSTTVITDSNGHSYTTTSSGGNSGGKTLRGDWENPVELCRGGVYSGGTHSRKSLDVPDSFAVEFTVNGIRTDLTLLPVEGGISQ